MSEAWPGLGFDPAPGDAVAAAVVARRLGAVAADLDGIVAALRAAVRPDDGWSGNAATAFATGVAVLPETVAGERDAFTRAATALERWARELGGLQTRARDLEARAAAARSPEDVDAARASAGALADEHAAAAAAVAEALAADAGPAQAWLGAHLDDIGDVAAMISGVAGALAFVPVLTPVMAPVALVSGAVALAADVADAGVHDAWQDPRAVAEIGTDAAGLVPGVRFAAGAARAVGDAASAVRAADGFGPAVGAGARTFAHEEAAAAATYRQPGLWAIGKGKALAAKTGVDAELAARGFEVQARLTRAVTRARQVGKEHGT